MKPVLWRPEMNLPSELTMVQTKPGKLTRNQWLEALADRVQSMVMASEDPALWMRLAAKEMDLPTLETKAAGQLLVLHKLALQTAFDLHDLGVVDGDFHRAETQVAQGALDFAQDALLVLAIDASYGCAHGSLSFAGAMRWQWRGAEYRGEFLFSKIPF